MNIQKLSLKNYIKRELSDPARFQRLFTHGFKENIFGSLNKNGKTVVFKTPQNVVYETHCLIPKSALYHGLSLDAFAIGFIKEPITNMYTKFEKLKNPDLLTKTAYIKINNDKTIQREVLQDIKSGYMQIKHILYKTLKDGNIEPISLKETALYFEADGNKYKKLLSKKVSELDFSTDKGFAAAKKDSYLNNFLREIKHKRRQVLKTVKQEFASPLAKIAEPKEVLKKIDQQSPHSLKTNNYGILEFFGVGLN